MINVKNPRTGEVRGFFSALILGSVQKWMIVALLFIAVLRMTGMDPTSTDNYGRTNLCK